jgi:metal-responsive CopG/Arc/MetJ family transcriptional regulator
VAVRKIAISVPEHVLAQIDEAAAERGKNRSRFITDMLVLLARARTDREISRRVNAVFAEPEVAREQVQTARASSRALARVVKSSRW